jgi:MFS family permease
VEQHTAPAQDHDRIPSQIIISFSSTDPEAPNNWPFRKKFIIFIGGIMSVINSTLASSMPAGASAEIAKHFSVRSDLELVLPISTFLIGYTLGPILCGPLSENYGRKIVFLVAFLLYTLFTMATALAPNWPSFLIFRWLCGVMASAPIAVVGGLYADIFENPRKRGVAMACFMAATTFGPVLGPLISGFAAPVAWNWPFFVSGRFFHTYAGSVSLFASEALRLSRTKLTTPSVDPPDLRRRNHTIHHHHARVIRPGTPRKEGCEDAKRDGQPEHHRTIRSRK